MQHSNIAQVFTLALLLSAAAGQATTTAKPRRGLVIPQGPEGRITDEEREWLRTPYTAEEFQDLGITDPIQQRALNALYAFSNQEAQKLEDAMAKTVKALEEGGVTVKFGSKTAAPTPFKAAEDRARREQKLERAGQKAQRQRNEL